MFLEIVSNVAVLYTIVFPFNIEVNGYIAKAFYFFNF